MCYHEPEEGVERESEERRETASLSFLGRAVRRELISLPRVSEAIEELDLKRKVSSSSSSMVIVCVCFRALSPSLSQWKIFSGFSRVLVSLEQTRTRRRKEEGSLRKATGRLLITTHCRHT